MRAWTLHSFRTSLQPNQTTQLPQNATLTTDTVPGQAILGNVFPLSGIVNYWIIGGQVFGTLASRHFKRVHKKMTQEPRFPLA